MSKRIFILCIVFATVQFHVHGQETVSITKKEVLNSILEKNLSLKISEQEFNQSKAEYLQTSAIFLPTITASYTGISTTNPLMAFGSKLNQEILTAADFNPALLNNPSPTQNFGTKIEIQQPLINLDGVYQRKAAKSKMEATSLQGQRTADYLALEVEKAYMQLQLAYKAVEVMESALETAKENEKLAVNNFEQGYLQQADMLNIKMRVTEIKGQLQTAKSNVLNASNYLSFLMNDDANVVYKPIDDLRLTSTDVSNVTLSENRADIKAMQLASEAYMAMNKADKMTFLPRLNAFGSYEIYDNKLFQGSANGYVLGAQLSWNIFEGSKRFGKAKKSKAAFEQSKLAYTQYLSKSNLELNKAKRQFIDAKNQLELTALSVKQSKESLRIRKNRFKEGLEKTTDLLQAETVYAQKQLAYYQTLFQYNYTQAYLEFLTKK